MQIHISGGHIPITESIESRVRADVEDALTAVSTRVTRVDVHFKDVNGDKGGMDKRVTIEARIAGMDPVAVTDDADDLYAAIGGAAGKLSRAVAHKKGKSATH